MTASNYKPLVQQLLGIEGGVADRPAHEDPGGLTNLGVTQAVYDKWRAHKGLPAQSVRKITKTAAIELYKTNYWDTVRADDLPSGVDFAVFDYSVNSGPRKAVADLQAVIGAKIDGIVGLDTMTRLAVCDPADVINGICDRRWAFMQRLKNFKYNKNGWRTRVAHVRAEGLKMAAGLKPALPTAELTSAMCAKAEPPGVTPAKKSLSVWGGLAALCGLVVNFFKGLFTMLSDFLMQAPDFAKTTLTGIGSFAEHSPVAQGIATAVGGVGAIGVAYLTWRTIQNKKEAGA